MARLDLSGQRYGRLVVVGFFENRGSRPEACWLCRCDCGKEAIVRAGNLRSGNSSSCGCLQAENRIKHNMHDSPENQAWRNLWQRCHNPKATGYQNYGGRGVKVSSRWQSFSGFLADMGLRPGPGYSIERRNNDGDYEPSNCYWANASAQGRNKRTNRHLKHKGRRLTLVEWSQRTGLPYETIRTRLRLGWPVTKALEEPCKIAYRRRSNATG